MHYYLVTAIEGTDDNGMTVPVPDISVEYRVIRPHREDGTLIIATLGSLPDGEYVEELDKKDPIVTTRTDWEDKHPKEKDLEKFAWKEMEGTG